MLALVCIYMYGYEFHCTWLKLGKSRGGLCAKQGVPLKLCCVEADACYHCKLFDAENFLILVCYS